jgi:DEK C terminal domain
MSFLKKISFFFQFFFALRVGLAVGLKTLLRFVGEERLTSNMAQTLTPSTDPSLNETSAEPADSGVDATVPSEAIEQDTPADSSSVDATAAPDTTSTEDSTTTSNDHKEESVEKPLPNEDEIIEAMRKLLKGLDLSSVTLRSLLGLLEKEFGQDLSHKKAFVKEKIPLLVSEVSEAASEEKDEDDEADKEDKETKGM